MQGKLQDASLLRLVDTVLTSAVRRLAELLAWWVPGSTDVKNELVPVDPA